MSTEIGDVRARMTLDSAPFDAGMKKAAASVTPTLRAMEAAAKRSAQAQAEAAKYAGDAVTEQGRRILAARQQVQQALRDQRTLLSASKKGYLDEAEGSRAVTAAIQQELAARKALAAAMAMGEGHGHDFSDRMAASSVVRAGEGNPGIRSIENFLVTIPGMAGAMRALFPIIGAAGLTGLLVNMGIEGVEAIEKVRNSAAALRDAFQESDDRAAVTIDDLELENQKIQDQIDKISGHPNNGLATALLEAKKMADDLVVSLQEDRKQLEALLKEHDTGALGLTMAALGIGPGSTRSQQKDLRADQSQLSSDVSDARAEFDRILASDADPAAKQAAADRQVKAIHEIYQRQIDAYNKEAKRLRDAQQTAQVTVTRNGVIRSYSDNSAAIAVIEGRAKQLARAQAEDDLKAVRLAKSNELEQKQREKELGRGGNKADDDRLKQMDAYVAQWEIESRVTAKALYDYWEVQKSTFKVGSDQFRQILEKQATIAKAGAEKVARAFAEARAGNLTGASQVFTGAITPKEDEGGKALAEGQRGIDAMRQRASLDQQQDAIDANQMAITNAEASAREQEIGITERAGRSMTQYAAALETARVHAEEFQTVMESLQAILDIRQQAAAANPSRENDRAVTQAQIAIAQAQSRRNLEVQQESYQLSDRSSSDLVGVKDALADFVRNVNDASTAARGFAQNTISTLNETILASMSGQRVDWGNAGADIFRNAGGIALTRAEGSILSGLPFLGGMGKMGSQANPIWTRTADMAQQAAQANNIATSVLGRIFGGGSGSSGGNLQNVLNLAGAATASDQAGGGLSTIASTLTDLVPFIPGFATGGDPQVGRVSIVGERGPELFVPKVSGTIIANSKVRPWMTETSAPDRSWSDFGTTPEVADVASRSYAPAVDASSFSEGDTHHWNIDARGSNDPAAVRRQIMQAAPHIAAAAVKAVSEKRMRQPSMKK